MVSHCLQSARCAMLFLSNLETLFWDQEQKQMQPKLALNSVLFYLSYSNWPLWCRLEALDSGRGIACGGSMGLDFWPWHKITYSCATSVSVNFIPLSQYCGCGGIVRPRHGGSSVCLIIHETSVHLALLYSGTLPNISRLFGLNEIV